jgi:NAD(P)H-hydrate repair Nnr-like enzyme with NAD(P)H-hydrate dehydratase domain/NAD(P)H-hydrate repair Nnr-like enzyme with NAD(P)H-hydrate epimerase domain
MNQLCHVSCLSCLEMSQFEQAQFEACPEKRESSLRLATQRAAKDILKNQPWSHTLIFAGPAGNGSDAWGIACLLKEAGWDPVVIFLEMKSPLCKQMAQKAIQANIQHVNLTAFFEDPHFLTLRQQNWDLIIDGLFALQAKSELSLEILQAIEWANVQKAHRIALDCPTGWPCPEKGIFKADLTYCFHTVKRELLQKEVRSFCGRFKRIDVGFMDPHQGSQIFTQEDPLDLLPFPETTWHKYKRGSLYLAVGSHRYPGSALLAENVLWEPVKKLGHLAGMIYTLQPPHHPQSVQWPLSPPKNSPNALVIGSGMEASDEHLPRIFELAASFDSLVLDAGALEYIEKEAFDFSSFKRCQIVLTPHEGEARRLFKLSKEASLEVVFEQAQAYAASHHLWVLVKSYISFLACPDGRSWIEPFASACLAVAGSGDKLAAMIGALSLHLNIEQAVLVACRLQAIDSHP